MDVLASSGETVSLLGQVIEASGEERVIYDNHLDLRP
jgi:phosphoribosylformylglycinamidine cyclo-ligase